MTAYPPLFDDPAIDAGPPESVQTAREWHREAFFRLLQLHRAWHIHPRGANCYRMTEAS